MTKINATFTIVMQFNSNFTNFTSFNFKIVKFYILQCNFTIIKLKPSFLIRQKMGDDMGYVAFIC